MKEALVPLWELIEGRRRMLRMDRNELVRRCGFDNVTHGRRAFERFWDGDLDDPGSARLVGVLPTALELSPTVLGDVVAACRAALRDIAQRRAREAFVPCGWLIGTRPRPSQITIFALTGGVRRWLRIPLDAGRPPLTYAGQVLAVARRTAVVPFFGPITGFAVSYHHDTSVRFDLDGTPVAVVCGPWQPGAAGVSLSGRAMPPLAG